ncbi:hypothetical protein M426DRAFT_28199 [Hypoxylon sp. CI-4A]|nr:hypothetical protein M426DRAFT_28199 [Hypoxylon sp. CI-4A]
MRPSGESSKKPFFSIQPPAHAQVGVGFPIEIKAPIGSKNGVMGFVTLRHQKGERRGSVSKSITVEGGAAGNWEAGGSRHNAMGFDSVIVTRPGRYSLTIQLYSDPAPNKDGTYGVQHLRDVISETFSVGERGSRS